MAAFSEADSRCHLLIGRGRPAAVVHPTAATATDSIRLAAVSHGSSGDQQLSRKPTARSQSRRMAAGLLSARDSDLAEVAAAVEVADITGVGDVAPGVPGRIVGGRVTHRDIASTRTAKERLGDG